MHRTASRLVGAALLLCFAATAHATQYPPGPGGAFPDTLFKVSSIQNPASVPFPVQPDTVWGIAGIITGFDPIPTGFAIYIQNSQGGPWTGVDVFTGGSNYIGDFSPPLALGDSIVCYGRLEEFSGETELRSFNGGSSFNPPLPIVRRVSQGNPLPPIHLGTVAELQELPTNPVAEQWEGCLVKVNGPLRVARQTGLGIAALPGANFIAVNNTVCPPAAPGPCDSLFIDTATLANLNAPAVGSVVNSVQGIYNQRTRGYRIQPRDGQDIEDTSPPNVADAFPVEDNIIRVVFDRNVTLASAQNTGNYTLGSLGLINSATQVSPTAVHLNVTNGLVDGNDESVTVNNIVSSSNNVPMTQAQTKDFYNGVLPISYIQAPDPAALGGTPCEDRSRLAGPGGAPGKRMSARGVCTLKLAGTSWIEDPTAGQRSGVAVFAPIGAVNVGRQYLFAGAVQEFFTETELVSNVYLVDEGAAASPVPEVQTVAVLRDTLCHPAVTVDGEDYEGVLVRVNCVQVDRTGLAGENFRVTAPYPTFTDTILVDNNVGGLTYVPHRGDLINVTGVMDVSFNSFRIQRRSDADVVPCTQTGVDDQLPTEISFSLFPNPSRSPRVAFGLPRGAQVELAVYDLLGRRLATLAKGDMAAGRYTRQWSGRLADGSEAGSGVYFYRLRVGDQVYNLRSVRMD